jgi:riboflavin kinase/FMN adenylyltransferase
MAVEVITGLDRVAGQLAGCVLTIGNFDGVHLGHQRLIGVAGDLAERAGARLVAMTFDPPPAAIVAPGAAPARILPRRLRQEYLGRAGVDVVVMVHTTEELLSVGPMEFARDIVARRLRPVRMVEGPNFHFGAGRAGDVEMLREMAAGLGFDVKVVEPARVELPGRAEVHVSSSLIRQLLRDGDVEAAATCLTRPFTLYGKVVGGERRGRVLEYPTANVRPAGMIAPGDGVYAASVELDGRHLAAAVSIGTKPTFGPKPRTIEANLLDTDGDFYGREIAVTFVQRLREQRKFPDAESLRIQIAEDVARVRQIVQ